MNISGFRFFEGNSGLNEKHSYPSVEQPSLFKVALIAFTILGTHAQKISPVGKPFRIDMHQEGQVGLVDISTSSQSYGLTWTHYSKNEENPLLFDTHVYTRFINHKSQEMSPISSTKELLPPSQSFPKITATDSGFTVISSNSSNPYDIGLSQRFDYSGKKLSGLIPYSDPSQSSVSYANVIPVKMGYQILWNTNVNINNTARTIENQIFGQSYFTDGTKMGPMRQISTHPAMSISVPLGWQIDKELLYVWTSLENLSFADPQKQFDSRRISSRLTKNNGSDFQDDFYLDTSAEKTKSQYQITLLKSNQLVFLWHQTRKRYCSWQLMDQFGKTVGKIHSCNRNSNLTTCVNIVPFQQGFILLLAHRDENLQTHYVGEWLEPTGDTITTFPIESSLANDHYVTTFAAHEDQILIIWSNNPTFDEGKPLGLYGHRFHIGEEIKISDGNMLYPNMFSLTALALCFHS